MKSNFELVQLVVLANKWLRDPDLSWEEKYDKIFDLHIARVMEEQGLYLEYCDPDTTYEDDVRAYMTAVNHRMSNFYDDHDQIIKGLIASFANGHGLPATTYLACQGLIDWYWGDDSVAIFVSHIEATETGFCIPGEVVVDKIYQARTPK